MQSLEMGARVLVFGSRSSTHVFLQAIDTHEAGTGTKTGCTTSSLFSKKNQL
jgi:hypothetical protein